MEAEVERLPDARAVRYVGAGSQSFPALRRAGGLYVDKTELIYALARRSKYVYLSRPKRFGKSLLVSTLEAYWQGRRWLFEGLRMAELEREWAEHFVVRLDMSRCGEHLYTYHAYLNPAMAAYEKRLGLPAPREDELRSYGARLSRIIKAASVKTGRGVVVLIDEYDFVLQHTWGTPEYDLLAQAYREFFTTLKAEEDYIEYVFLTGIARFAALGIFSALNNLENVSFRREYATLLGLTEQEIRATYWPEVERLAESVGRSAEAVFDELRWRFDGYHFHEAQTEGLYNPFFLLSILKSSDLEEPLGEGQVTAAVRRFVSGNYELAEFEGAQVRVRDIRNGVIAQNNLPVLLYQTGFLTLKGREGDNYVVGFPNAEVRETLYNEVLPGLIELSAMAVATLQQRLKRALQAIDIEQITLNLQALLAKVPFHHIDKEAIKHEERYALATATVLGSLGYETQQEVVCSTGVTDLVSKTEHQIYVCECKLRGNGGLSAAERQLRAKGYEAQFAADPREKVLLALEFDDQGGGLLELRRVKG